mgnify:CR=1 FL=1
MPLAREIRIKRAKTVAGIAAPGDIAWFLDRDTILVPGIHAMPVETDMIGQPTDLGMGLFIGPGDILLDPVAVTERPKGFGNHAIASDGWLLNCYDLSKGPGTQFLKDMMTSSSDHRGATGPTIFQLGFGVEYVGEEKCNVGAGTFDALHFRIVDTEGQLPETHPPYDMWCTADGDYILLKAAVTGYMMTHYELIELQR